MIGGMSWTPWNAGSLCEANGAGAASDGTVLTANASANTKGTYVTVKNGTSFAYKALLVSFVKNNTAADYVVDIGISVGGNSFVIAENLRFSTSRRAANEGTNYYWLPIYVPAGAVLVARCAAGTGGATMHIMIHGFSNGWGGMPSFSRCLALYTSASSRGVAVDAGASADTKGAYAQLVASSAFPSAAIMTSIGTNNDVARTTGSRFFYDIAIGAAASEQVLLSNIGMIFTSTFDVPWIADSPIYPLYIPLGSRVAVRCQSSNNVAGDRTFDIGMWGFVP